MASVVPVKSRLLRSRLLFMYHSAPVWLFGFGWVIFDRAKNAGLSEPGHFPQQGAGEQRETIPFLSQGTTTVMSSVPLSELVRGLSWSSSCRFSPESWSDLKQAEYS